MPTHSRIGVDAEVFDSRPGERVRAATQRQELDAPIRVAAQTVREPRSRVNLNDLKSELASCSPNLAPLRSVEISQVRKNDPRYWNPLVGHLSATPAKVC